MIRPRLYNKTVPQELYDLRSNAATIQGNIYTCTDEKSTWEKHMAAAGFLVSCLSKYQLQAHRLTTSFHAEHRNLARVVGVEQGQGLAPACLGFPKAQSSVPTYFNDLSTLSPKSQVLTLNKLNSKSFLNEVSLKCVQSARLVS